MKEKEVIIETNCFADDAARLYLLESRFDSHYSANQAFPGEGQLFAWDLVLASSSGLRIDESRYGSGSKPGLRLLKIMKDKNQPEKGWEVHLQRVVLQNRQIINGFGAYEDLKIDLQTGQMSLSLSGEPLPIKNPRKTAESLTAFMRDFQVAHELIEAGFTLKESGMHFNLKH